MSPDAIPAMKVGHIRSPQLKEMYPTTGIGWTKYSLYIYLMMSSPKQLAEIGGDQNVQETVWSAITSSAALRALFCEALSFFLMENVLYDDKHDLFLTYLDNEAHSGNTPKMSLVGVISKDNLDDVRAMVLVRNYISPSKANVDIKFASEKAREIWEKAQAYLEKESSNKKENPRTSLGNIVSKLCAIHPSYNYLNVFDLTVFQLYDAFFQLCFMRSVEFSESIVANHGSKEFQYERWMDPVKNY